MRQICIEKHLSAGQRGKLGDWKSGKGGEKLERNLWRVLGSLNVAAALCWAERGGTGRIRAQRAIKLHSWCSTMGHAACGMGRVESCLKCA